jgi:preprotein translocase subunit SecG
VVILVVILHVLMCLAIIGLVLLQAGKGADIGSAFGGGGSQAVFGSMGTPTVLGKATAAVAIGFMMTSFFLAGQGSRRAGSIMPTSSPPPASAPAPASGGAPAPSAPAAPAQK